ncbi:MAG: FAD-dependent oxidoreductase [Acidimicrobiia bacterium]|nr:FAD-dependent oxidoreductase [Acidimicrobiia bacterium]
MSTDEASTHGDQTTQVVVIGGGVVGCSVLYHLTKNGWTDAILLERTELTAGSTWHSAGGMHTLNGDPNVAKLQQYTIELYQEIEELSGRDCGIHLTGGIMLADTPERMDWLRMAHARGRYLGMETELISVAEAKRLMPLLEEQYFVGAMFDRHEGHVDPSGVTNAYAQAARDNGASVLRNSWARSLRRRSDGRWLVEVFDTTTGELTGRIACEHVVNAGGLWAREVGRMAGLELPVLAMEHMYLLTDEIPAIAEYNEAHGEVLHCIDFGGEIYMRQEGNGLLLGTYEREGQPWSPEETPWDFGMRLLTPDLDRIAESLDVGFRHFPIFAEAGIKQVINGPFTFSPDGNPLLGPIRGLPGFWSACAVMAGLSQGGGVGLALANWMTDGDPGFDIWGMDVARFGDWATLGYTNAKVRENYSRRFRIQYPNEVLPAARPLQTSPLYDRLVAENAVWGDAFGLESALWYQRPGLDPVEDVTFGRSNAWGPVGEEVRAVRSGVGLIETTGFSKFLFEGPGARALLDRLITNRVPKPGRIALAPMTNEAGRLVGDLTVACLRPTPGLAEGPLATLTGGATQNVGTEEQFVVFGSGIAERYYERWFDRHLPLDGSVRYATLGFQTCGLLIAGPRSRELLARLTRTDVSADAFRFLDFTTLDVGLSRLWCGRISYTGDLGYELWMPASHQRAVYESLREAGEDLGLTLFGLGALDSLRLDKGFGSWAREYRPIYDPYEAGLDRFVKLDTDFIGRDALASIADRGPERRLLTWTVETGSGTDDDPAVDVIGDEPIWHDGRVVGWVTSGGYAHHSDCSVALGYVPAALEDADEGFEIEIVGMRRPAKPVRGCLWDPDGRRMRG